MIYLLDVNVLLALAYPKHVHHARTTQWLLQLQREAPKPLRLATCAITELGFVRIAGGKAALAESVEDAKADLLRLRKDREVFEFLGDELGCEQLPDWVERSSQTTDGHLMELAGVYQARFVTLDAGIPGAVLIPSHQDSWQVREPTASYEVAA